MTREAASLSKYDKRLLGQKANELDFIRDTLEKVYRLVDALEYLNQNPLLKENLALKGGTAINLTIFNLPRLSIDIDLDYCNATSREEMLGEREIISKDIVKYMQTQNYTLSPKTKNTYSLDSWIFDYINSGGNNDNIKIEINYSMRTHILPVKERKLSADFLSIDLKINSLDVIDIFGSKIITLLNRTAARDLYDVYNMVNLGIFNKNEYDLLKKSVIFYSAVSLIETKAEFNTSAINTLTGQKIKTDLLPVIRKKEFFNLELAKERVKEFINELLTLNPEEKKFLIYFKEKHYQPELLFNDPVIIERIKNHPMALWKIRNKNL